MMSVIFHIPQGGLNGAVALAWLGKTFNVIVYDT